VTGPRDAALDRATRLLDRRRPLRADECEQLIADLPLVPGLLRRVVATLATQRDAAAVDALLALPAGAPGVIEALFAAFVAGARRRRPDGSEFPLLLALDFPRSRSPAFADLLARAQASFGDAFERLSIGGRACWRIVIAQGRGTLAGRASAAAYDLVWLHERLARLRGSRLWLNGWCFTSDGPVRSAAQVHLVRAWLQWAASRTGTRQ
jgi:hypothetical protein